MGCCLSSKKKERVAKVVWMSGELREYTEPVTVEHVLLDANKESRSYFICNSDSLYFDQIIPALDSGDPLRADHIYFVLEESKRQRPLSAADMAALALKATAAIDATTKKKRRKTKTKRYSRISPQGNSGEEFSHPPEYDYQETIGGGNASKHHHQNINYSRSSSVRKLQRLTSRRAKMAVRSFRLRLSTIYESTILSA